MNNIDNRRHPRLNHRAKIKVMKTDTSESFIADMRDFSETGLFLIDQGKSQPVLGAILEIQTTEIEDAPIRSTKVVRIEPGVGFGLVFL